MRIVVVASSGPVACPYCHDVLAEKGKSCERCGTSYHEECARLAVRCALLGCEGRLVAAVEGEQRFALVVVPPPDSTDALETVLVRVMGFTRWDAQHKLKGKVPQILGWLPREKVEAALAELEGAKLHAFAVQASALVVRSPFVVRTVRREGGRLHLANVSRERRVLDLSAPRFVVVGRIRTTTEHTRLEGGRTTTKFVHTTEHGMERFVHVWQPGESTPVAFDQTEFHDFTFLAEKKSATAFENMKALGELLAAGQPSDSSLEPHAVERRFALTTSRLLAHAHAPWLRAP